VQLGERNFTVAVDGITVVGVPPSGRGRSVKRRLYEAGLALAKDDGLLIFGADLYAVRTRAPNTILIQHGVSWDLPARYLTEWAPCKYPGLRNLWKAYLQYRAKCFFHSAPNRVCVDYNFLNWYRTQTNEPPGGKVWVIPNFAPLDETITPVSCDNSGAVRVLFARRFTRLRGTRLMADAVSRLLQDEKRVLFTFAGEGPDEGWLRQTFATEPRVSFTNYHPRDALRVNAAHDISVIPSLGSEGTCLSLAEALAAGRAVVATNVGGITNMVLSGYNGVLINPDPMELTDSLKELIADGAKRHRLGCNALATAREAFGLERWRERWREVLMHVSARNCAPGRRPCSASMQDPC